MLPFIEKEVIHVNGWLTTLEFMDVLAISQITPGPIAINAATFIGFRYSSFVGALVATLGIISGPFVFMSILSPFLKKYKDTDIFGNIFVFLRPITVALILSAAYSTLSKSLADIKSIVIFSLSLILLQRTKLHPVLLILSFGVIGILFF